MRNCFVVKCTALVALYFLCQESALALPSPAINYSLQISPDSSMQTVNFLASDSLKGRETGTAGQKAASAYISNKFKEYGLKTLPGLNGFEQHHSIPLRRNSTSNIELHQRHFLFLEDFFYRSGHKDTCMFLHSITFAGYGISGNGYDDYNELDVRGKALLMYDGQPPLFRNKRDLNDSGKLWTKSAEWKKKIDVINEKQPAIVFIVTNNILNLSDSLLNESRKQATLQVANTASDIPVIFITEEMALNFFPEHEQYRFTKAKKQIDRKGKPASFTSTCDAVIPLSSGIEHLTGENIIGMIEGSGNNNEYIFITAHYDHLGERDSLIYPGADDNASGCATVMELARVFSKAAREGEEPGRSLIFMLVSGEEMGLLGSTFFTDNPPVDLKDIVANLNTDMIGRTDNFHDSLGIRDYVYIIGSDKLSQELHLINESSNKNGPNLLLNYRYNLPDDPNQYYYRSDHYNFARNNIPVIFYFNGIHKDYHMPGDTADKIDSSLLCKRARLIFLTAWELGNREKRILINKKNSEAIKN